MAVVFSLASTSTAFGKVNNRPSDNHNDRDRKEMKADRPDGNPGFGKDVRNNDPRTYDMRNHRPEPKPAPAPEPRHAEPRHHSGTTAAEVVAGAAVVVGLAAVLSSL